VASHFFYALLRFSPLAVLFYALVLVYAALLGVFTGVVVIGASRAAGIPRPLALAIAVALLEFCISQGDLSFPASIQAHNYGVYPAFLEITAWTGPHVMPLVSIGVAWLLHLAWKRRHDARARAVALAAAAGAGWLALPLAGVVAQDTDSTTAEMRIGVVQPFATVAEKADPERRAHRLNRLEELSREIAADVDLLVWPESARPGPIGWEELRPVEDDAVQALSTELGVPILYGTELGRLRMGRILSIYNAALLVHPDGRKVQWYGKQQLLPFAEGVPFADLFGWTPEKRAEARRERGDERSTLSLMGNFSPGPEPTIFEVGDLRIGVMICFETQYPGLGRTFRTKGANLLVVMTNDAWWGRSIFAEWHASMASARAQEADVPVVRAANSGVSSFVDEHGRTYLKTGIEEVATLVAEVEVDSGEPTFYARHGEWLIVSILLALAVASAWRAVRKRRSGDEETPVPSPS
jgi:apolipoprotein N-acyltransferase